ncbi:hypothetical protein HZA56_12900 [Candidatus Poribacteria bacterium]|nr:hypothetical protein [Candidatus Poribacteria bacterium]
MSDSRTLHLGCGTKKAQGATGIDFNPYSHADIIHDLNVTPWPLETGVFDRVICAHERRRVKVRRDFHRIASH